MNIQTYFGFFAEAVMMAVGTSLTKLTGQAVNLGEVQVSTTNALKLRWSEVETVLLPIMAAKAEVNAIFALTEADVDSLNRLADGRISFHKLLEQVISTAAEPFNFITKRRNRLTGVDISRNVVGFTAHHLGGEINYTQAKGIFTVHRKPGFALRFLVTAHQRPDGDALGSSLALAGALRELGKMVVHLAPDPVPYNFRFLPGVETIVMTVPERVTFDAT